MDALKTRLLEINARDRAGEYRTPEAKAELARIAEGVDLDLSHEEIRSKNPEGSPAGTEILTWARVFHKGTYPALALLQGEPPETREAIIAWLLSSPETSDLGAGCYRLSPVKTDAMYDASAERAFLTDCPSGNRDFIEPCLHHKGVLEFLRRVHRTFLDSGAPDEIRGGALRSIYWTGVEHWPSPEEYDAHTANPEEARARHMADAKKRSVPAMMKYLGGPGSTTSPEEVLGNLMRSYDRRWAKYSKFRREDLAEAVRMRREIASAAPSVFLDESRSIELRKMALLEAHDPWMDESARALMPEVFRAMETFPDAYVQGQLRDRRAREERRKREAARAAGWRAWPARIGEWFARAGEARSRKGKG